MSISIPKVNYAPCGDLYIAYQVWGPGPLDLIIVPGFVSHLEHMWEEPGAARYLRRLGSFSRVVAFDKRGTGLSDRNTHVPTMDERMEDVLAVMKAANCEKAALLGISEGGPMSILFAATYPERTMALILYGSYAKGCKSEDYPWMLSREQYEKWISDIPLTWGNPDSLKYWAPDVAEDAHFRDWWGKLLRLGASPQAAINLVRLYYQIDVRPILSAISKDLPGQ